MQGRAYTLNMWNKLVCCLEYEEVGSRRKCGPLSGVIRS
jgi:hypothetical protein